MCQIKIFRSAGSFKSWHFGYRQPFYYLKLKQLNEIALYFPFRHIKEKRGKPTSYIHSTLQNEWENNVTMVSRLKSFRYWDDACVCTFSFCITHLSPWPWWILHRIMSPLWQGFLLCCLLCNTTLGFPPNAIQGEDKTQSHFSLTLSAVFQSTAAFLVQYKLVNNTGKPPSQIVQEYFGTGMYLSLSYKTVSF